MRVRKTIYGQDHHEIKSEITDREYVRRLIVPLLEDEDVAGVTIWFKGENVSSVAYVRDDGGEA